MNIRLLYVDVAKGIGILLVVVGHLSWGCHTREVHSVINIFHMPFWFFVSAFFFKGSTWYELLTKKVSRLVIPYFFYGLFAFVLYYKITPPSHILTGLKEQMVHFCIGMRSNGYMFSSTLWFLSSLFGVYVISNLFTRITDKKYANTIKFLLILTLFNVGMLSDYYDIILPLNLDVSIYMLPYFFLGYYSKDTVSKIPKVNNRFFLMLTLSAIVFFFYYICIERRYISDVNIYACKFGVYPFNYISAFGGIMILLLLSQFISRYENSYMSKILSWLGKNSIIIFIVHQAFIIHPLNCCNILAENTMTNGILRFSIVILISSCLVPVINKYLYWSIGLRKELSV